MLGRGNNQFIFTQEKVIKLSASKEEAEFMKTHDDVFVPVLATNPLTMYRWEEHTGEETKRALFVGLKLLRLLWHQDGKTNPEWHHLLRHHLQDLYYRHRQRLVYPKWQIDELVMRVKFGYDNGVKSRVIHGDPTAANLLRAPMSMRKPRYNYDYRWIDPLHRPYIPGDAHVDLGKMFQSCWGYEDILRGSTTATFDKVLAKDLAAEVGMNFNLAYDWATIHLMRLLPYQEERVHNIFCDVLNEIFEEL